MYEEEPTRDELYDIEAELAIRAWSPTFWDADAVERTTTDPYVHPSWEVAADLQGWDDPAEAVLLLQQTVIEDARLTPLADTAYGPPPLVLVPVDTDGTWPAALEAGDFAAGRRAAA